MITFDSGCWQTDPWLTDEEPSSDVGRLGRAYSVSKGVEERPELGSWRCVNTLEAEDLICPNTWCSRLFVSSAVSWEPAGLAEPRGPRLGPQRVDLPGEAPAGLATYPLSSHFLSQPPSSVHNESPTSAGLDCHSNPFFERILRKETIVYLNGPGNQRCLEILSC